VLLKIFRLIFTDLRLLNSTDMQNLADYPIRLFDVIPQKLCSVCSDEVAAYVLHSFSHVPQLVPLPYNYCIWIG
jgi:hypothetical protein